MKTDNTWLEISRIKLVPFTYSFFYHDNNVRVLGQFRFKPFLDVVLSVHFCFHICVI